MWLYEQATGRLYHGDKLVATGYSGHEQGVNSPLFQHVPNVGPVPQGSYIIAEPYDSPVHGKFCMRLAPQTGTNTFGRSGFLIHGDSIEHPGMKLASHGCIIMDRKTRQMIYDSNDVLLVVVSGVAQNVA